MNNIVVSIKSAARILVSGLARHGAALEPHCVAQPDRTELDDLIPVLRRQGQALDREYSALGSLTLAIASRAA
jgi:hypothetical protein